jgi:glutathione S-transferase
MKLYDSKLAPNPRRARIFLAEKGISVPTEQIDIPTLQHKTPEYTAINPLQRMPALVLDDGTIITESIAICHYFEMLHPEPRRRQSLKCGIAGRKLTSSPMSLRCFAIRIRP